MISRSNAVILSFATLGMVVWFAGGALTNLSDAVLIGVLILVGVVAPQLLNTYLDDRDAD